MSDRLGELEAAAEGREKHREAVEAVGEAECRAVAKACREFEDLMDRYEERATDWDDFEGYLEFQERVVDFVESLPEDLPERDAFEEVDEIFHQRTLSASDFEHARETLASAREYADRIERWEQAEEEYREARAAVRERIEDLETEIAALERLQRLGDADLDAPTDRLEGPIETYNDRVTDAFRTLKRGRSARACLDAVAAAEAFPLVDYDQPPERLRTYVETADVGEEPIPQLLEYAGFSNSKLDHYVADPDELKRHVATNRTYLDRLDAGPLTVDWPPPEAATLRWRCEERLSVLARFAPDPVLEALREVRALADHAEYDRLRTAAIAAVELTDSERERIENEDIEGELETARAERDRLQAALD